MLRVLAWGCPLHVWYRTSPEVLPPLPPQSAPVLTSMPQPTPGPVLPLALVLSPPPPPQPTPVLTLTMLLSPPPPPPTTLMLPPIQRLSLHPAPLLSPMTSSLP